MIRLTPRTARKTRTCACGQRILPGDLYLEQVVSPDHGEVGNVGWWRAAECYPCVSRHGRGYLFIGMPGDQDAAYYAGYEIWNQRPTARAAA